MYPLITQFHHLERLQSAIAPRPCRLAERLGALFLPRLAPTSDRLTVNAQPMCDLPLMEAAIKQPDGFKLSALQFLKKTFDASGITHIRRLTWVIAHISILRHIS